MDTHSRGTMVYYTTFTEAVDNVKSYEMAYSPAADYPFLSFGDTKLQKKMSI